MGLDDDLSTATHGRLRHDRALERLTVTMRNASTLRVSADERAVRNALQAAMLVDEEPAGRGGPLGGAARVLLAAFDADPAAAARRLRSRPADRAARRS